MIATSDFKNGMKIEMDNTPYEILEHQHHKPGKGGAIMRTRLRNLLNGRVVEHTFRSGEKVQKPDLESRNMQFLYREGNDFVFMDLSTYEQLYYSVEKAGTQGSFLVDGQELKVLVFRGEPLALDMPASVIMEVVESEPGTKGDTVSGATKPATLSSGVTINVPLFINVGDMVKVDTRNSSYIGREK